MVEAEVGGDVFIKDLTISNSWSREADFLSSNEEFLSVTNVNYFVHKCSLLDRLKPSLQDLF